MIKIDESYSLNQDGFRGCVLIFTETRQKETKDGEIKDYIFQDRWYYPEMSKALQKYIELTSKNIDNLEEYFAVLKETNKRLKQVRDKFTKEMWLTK